MKTLWILMLIPLLSWAQPMSTQKKNPDLNAYQLVQVFDEAVAQQMPRALQKIEVHNLKIHKDSLSFRIYGAKFVLTLLSEKEHILSFNGQLFKSEEIKTIEEARRSIAKKFGFQVRSTSWLSFLVQKAWANTPVDPTGGSVERAFHSYSFVPEEEKPFVDLRSTSLAELPEVIGKSSTQEALGIIGSLLTAVGEFSKNPALQGVLDLGVPSNRLPDMPNFRTSPTVVR